jgi:hypothetical protein
VLTLIPERGIRLNEFKIEDVMLTLSGEATDTEAGFAFRERVMTSPALSRYEWNFPVPQNLDGTRVTFNAKGTWIKEGSDEGQ